MEKWQGKYRIPSARAAWWDYAQDGAYFITICTKDKISHFGTVKNGKMQLSTMGAIVQGFWYEIPHHFDFVRLGEFIVMPNHVHGILILEQGGRDEHDKNINVMGVNVEEIGVNVEEIGQCPISSADKTLDQKRLGNQGAHTVSSIIGSYKSVCSKHLHKTFPSLGFEWQTLFWDNIIKNTEAYDTISNYIINNPKKWEEDKFRD